MKLPAPLNASAIASRQAATETEAAKAETEAVRDLIQRAIETVSLTEFSTLAAAITEASFYSVGTGTSIPEETEYVLFVLSGESLAVGTGGSPAVSTSQNKSALMFAGGVDAAISSGDMSSFVPLVESTQETGAVAAADMLYDCILSDTNVEHNFLKSKIVFASDAVGNAEVAGLSPTTVSYDAYVQIVEKMNALASGRWRLGGIIWRQGEADQSADGAEETTPDTYKRRVRAIHTMKVMDAYRNGAATGGMAPPMLVQQFTSFEHSVVAGATGQPTIPLALLDLARDGDIPIHLSNPTYMLEHGDGIHLTNAGYKQQGALEGVALYALVFRRGDFVPLIPGSITYSGNEIRLRYPLTIYSKLVSDTAVVSDPGGLGFEVFGVSGSAEAIASVQITDLDEITITTDNQPGTGWKIGYALSGGADGGPTTGPRGTIFADSGMNNKTVAIEGTLVPCRKAHPVWQEVLA